MTGSNKEHVDSCDRQRTRRHCSLTASACEWLCKLELGDCESKCILQALVLHADSEGVSYPSLARLAAITDLHADTVRRRLVFLEETGYIRRVPQWRDANGVRNGDGRGKRTSDKIRLLIPAKIIAGEEARGSTEAPTALAANTAVQQHAAIESVSSSAALAQPSHSSKGLISEQEQELKESPPSPPAGGRLADESLKTFTRAWAEPITKLHLVQSTWTKLTSDERATATKAAAGYWAWRQSQGRPRTPISAQTFLRQRDGWAAWCQYAPQFSKTGAFVIELEGSDAWRARCTIAKITGTAAPTPIELAEGRGNRLPPLPPKYLNLAKYADEDAALWEFVDQRDVRCGAWCEFLGVEPSTIKVGSKCYEYNGRTYPHWPLKRIGLRVPCSWPPGYLDVEVPL